MSATIAATNPGMRLLIVDDDPKILRVLLRMLYADWEVEAAFSVGEARRMLVTRCYDAVLTDWDMPDGGGYAVMKAARQLTIDVPVVVHSGGDPKTIGKLAGNMMAGFVAKPAGRSEIGEALNKALGRLTQIEVARVDHNG